jgi:hypothetical protein
MPLLSTIFSERSFLISLMKTPDIANADSPFQVDAATVVHKNPLWIPFFVIRGHCGSQPPSKFRFFVIRGHCGSQPPLEIPFFCHATWVDISMTTKLQLDMEGGDDDGVGGTTQQAYHPRHKKSVWWETDSGYDPGWPDWRIFAIGQLIMYVLKAGFLKWRKLPNFPGYTLSSNMRLGLHFGRFFHKLIWSPCFDLCRPHTNASCTYVHFCVDIKKVLIDFD